MRVSSRLKALKAISRRFSRAAFASAAYKTNLLNAPTSWGDDDRFRDLVDPNPQGVAPPLLASLAGSHPRGRAAPFPQLRWLPQTPALAGGLQKRGLLLTLPLLF